MKGNRHKVELCKLERKDFIRTRELYEEVFAEDSRQFVDYYYDVKSPGSTALVLENEDGEIISMLHLNPYELAVRDGERFRSIPAYYVVAVATRQQYRHQGCMAGLLKEAEDFCRDKSVPFLFLMPADPEIYRPFGYKYIFSRPEFYFSEKWENSQIHLHRYLTTNSLLIEEKANTEKANTEQLRTEKICQELAEFAQKELEKQYDFFVKREKNYYVNLIKELESQNGEIGIYYNNNQIVGYYTKTGEEPNLFCGDDCICEFLFAQEFEELCKQRGGLPISQKQEKHPIMMGKIVDSPSAKEMAKETVWKTLQTSAKGWMIEIV